MIILREIVIPKQTNDYKTQINYAKLETKTSTSRNCQTPNDDSISQKPNQFTSPQNNITQRKQNSQVKS